MMKKSMILVATMTVVSPAWADGGVRESLDWPGYVIFGSVFLVFIVLTIVSLVKKSKKL